MFCDGLSKLYGKGVKNDFSLVGFSNSKVNMVLHTAMVEKYRNNILQEVFKGSTLDIFIL